MNSDDLDKKKTRLGFSLLVFASVFAGLTLTSVIVGAKFKTLPLLLVECTRINGNTAAAFSVSPFTIAWLVSTRWSGSAARGKAAATRAIQAR